jgi:protein FrlC
MLHVYKFAAMNLLYSHYSLDYFLFSISRMGFRNAEFWGGIPHYDIFADQTEQQKRIRRKFAEYDISVTCFTPEQCVYPFNIAAKEDSIRNKSIDYFSRCIEDAAGFGTDKMLITPGWGNYDEPAEEAWKRSLDSTDRLIQKAEEEGVTLAYEMLQPFESNLVTDITSLKKVMDTFDSPRLGICVDTVPACVAGESLKDYFDEFGERIIHIHLNDGTPSGHMAWGDGTQDLASHMDALKDFKGCITFETADTVYTDNPERAYEKNLAAVTEYLKKQGDKA